MVRHKPSFIFCRNGDFGSDDVFLLCCDLAQCMYLDCVCDQDKDQASENFVSTVSVLFQSSTTRTYLWREWVSGYFCWALNRYSESYVFYHRPLILPLPARDISTKLVEHLFSDDRFIPKNPLNKPFSHFLFGDSRSVVNLNWRRIQYFELQTAFSVSPPWHNQVFLATRAKYFPSHFNWYTKIIMIYWPNCLSHFINHCWFACSWYAGVINVI